MGDVRTIRQDNNIHNMHFELICNNTNRRRDKKRTHIQRMETQWKGEPNDIGMNKKWLNVKSSKHLGLLTVTKSFKSSRFITMVLKLQHSKLNWTLNSIGHWTYLQNEVIVNIKIHWIEFIFFVYSIVPSFALFGRLFIWHLINAVSCWMWDFGIWYYWFVFFLFHWRGRFFLSVTFYFSTIEYDEQNKYCDCRSKDIF